MGSLIEINDTLQITYDQGFPAELVYETHLTSPFRAEDFRGRIFRFKDKPCIRVYHMPPVRVFLVQNRDGKWLYWGLAHIVSVTHDYIKKTTSGEFQIEYIYSPDEMQKAHELIDRSAGTDFFHSQS